jgi:hypothetical protein
MRARGYDREEVAEIIGVTERTIRQKERRAKAYQFPLDVVAGSEARADYRNRGGDSCHEEDTGGDQQSVDSADESSVEGEPGVVDDASNQRAHVADDAALSGDVWPAVGSLAQFPETDEYVFVLNVSRTRDKLQGVRTSRLSGETCAQIAAAGEPSQLERLADAVRLVTEGPYCSVEAEAYEAVSLETVVNPDLLMEESVR